MASKALLLLGLFAIFLVVSETAVASARQPGTVKPQSEKTEQVDQYGPGYAANPYPGTGYTYSPAPPHP